MVEPKLEDISDYNTLKGEKKRVVWAVIIAGILIGGMYAIAYKAYSKTDAIPVKDKIIAVPFSKSIPVE